jgi:regulator of protease activity HflC (stomatin/prohibitin superfamily)
MLAELFAFVVLVLIVAAAFLRVLREYQRGVMFTLGRFSRVRDQA